MTDPIHVLHVDDERDFTEMAAEFLEREDDSFTVETATSASEGLERLASDDFECIVSDYDMPGQNGIEFLETVREEYPDLPFILFTGKGSEEVASEAIRAGVTDYLQKRNDTSQYELLANRITNAVEQIRAERRARLQKRQYRDLFEQAPLMYVLIRFERGWPLVEDCNERFLDKLGYDRDEVIGRPSTDFYTDESRRKVYEGGGYDRARDGEFGLEERTLVAKDGEQIETILRASPRLDERGDAVGLQTLYLDVTERRERTRRLELALQQTRSGVWEYDLESGMLTRHEGASGLWAENTHTTIPMADAIAERVHPDDRQAVWNALEATVDDGEPYRVEFRQESPSGYRWVEARGELLREHDAEPGRLIALTTDIHAYKEREQALQDERNRLSALFDDAPQPMIEGELRGDDHYPIVGMNDAFEATFGYDRAEIVGQDIADALVPEDERAEHERFRERVAAGESFSGEVERTTVDGDRTFLIDVVSYGTDSTPADGWFATYTDITERKGREEELELYETMIETVPDGVYVLDEDLRYVAVNHAMADLTGYSKEKLIDSHVSLINTEAAVESAERNREQLLVDGGVVDNEIKIVEHPHLTTDGEEIPCEVRFRALPPDDDGSFRGTVGVVRDISERKEYEEELEEYREYTDRLLDAVDDLFFVHDEEGNLQRWNDSFADVTGYDDEEIGSMSGTDFVPEEHRERTAAAIQEVFETGHARLEAPLVTTDGSEIPYEYVAARVEHPDGDLRLVGIGRDISERKERERELELYETMVETVPDGVYVLDEDFRYVAVNQGMADLTGYSTEELVGSHASLINDEEAMARAKRDRERLIADGIDDEVVVAEHPHVTADGETVLTEVRFRALPPTEDGEFRGTAGVLRDITERKRRERELEWYQTIVEASGDAVYTLDAEGQLTFVNDAFCELVGYTEDELLGEYVSIVMDEADIDRSEAIIRDLLTSEREHETVELDLIRADGEHVPCETHIALLPDDGGEFRGTTGIHRDITDRKRREEALDALHGATRAFMEAADKQTIAERAVETTRTVLDLPINGLWLHDAEADVLRPVAVTEEGEDLLGDPPTYTGGESLSWEAFEGGELRVYEDFQDEPTRLNPETPIQSEIIVPLGEYGVMNIGATEPAAFDDIDISLARILGNTVEAALSRAEREEQLRAQRRELERQNERLEQFASVVSHDLRNPLNVAEGNVELAQEECDSEHLDTAARALDRMNTLIEDLLTVAREGTSVEDVETVDLADIVDACWANVETADATLVVDTDATIRADRSRLAQLLENLFANAVEHGGSDVTIPAGDLDDGTGFYVADDGPGIPPDEREAVFDAGYSTNREGTGFGLSIVQEIAEAHGWEVSVTDSGTGGARFEITGVSTSRTDE